MQLKFLWPFCFVACRTTTLIHSPQAPVQDHVWLNEETLQIVVPAQSKQRLPETLRRQESCQQARSQIQPHLFALYPKAKKLKFQAKVVYTMYLKEGSCSLVVEVSGQGLKNQLL